MVWDKVFGEGLRPLKSRGNMLVIYIKLESLTNPRLYESCVGRGGGNLVGRLVFQLDDTFHRLVGGA